MNKAALVDVRWQGRTDQSSAVSETCIKTMVTLTTVPGICVFQKWKRKTLLLASWNYDSAAQQLYKGAAQRNNSPWRWRRSASDILIVCVSMQKKKAKRNVERCGREICQVSSNVSDEEGRSETDGKWLRRRSEPFCQQHSGVNLTHQSQLSVPIFRSNTKQLHMLPCVHNLACVHHINSSHKTFIWTLTAPKLNMVGS